MPRVLSIVLAAILLIALLALFLLWGINKFKIEQANKEEVSILLIQKEKKIDSLKRELEYSKELIETLQFSKKDSYYFYDMNEKRYFCFGGYVVIKEFTNNKPPDLFEDWTEDVELANY
jgi:cell division protein YceG involved in septum cleavage